MIVSSHSQDSSQIETRDEPLRVVLLGASNLSIMFPTVVESARANFAQPLEMLVAKRFGRSYGSQSKIFWKKFSGILQSDLWAAMAQRRALHTVAMVADIGNDLVYEAPVAMLVRWIESTLDRPAQHDAHAVLNNIPLFSWRTVGLVRYRMFRALFFPSCRSRAAK